MAIPSACGALSVSVDIDGCFTCEPDRPGSTTPIRCAGSRSVRRIGINGARLFYRVILTVVGAAGAVVVVVPRQALLRAAANGLDGFWPGR